MKRIHHRGAEAQRKSMFLNLRALRGSFLNIEYRMRKLTGRSGKRQGASDKRKSADATAWLFFTPCVFHSLFVIPCSLFDIQKNLPPRLCGEKFSEICVSAVNL